jgi:hypothetical protein
MLAYEYELKVYKVFKVCKVIKLDLCVLSSF